MNLRLLCLVVAIVAGFASAPVFAQGQKLRVAAVMPFPVNDLTWTQALHAGLERLHKEGKIDYQYTENVSNADAERVMRR
ncbi:MAG: BMP family ABC transporter substrate-binding protein, partial [Betaproteobacteria bacterium]